MKRNLPLIAVAATCVLAVLASSGCNRVTAPSNNTTPIPLTTSEKQVESANNSFATTLFGQVAVQGNGKNFFISPLSVSMALAMTLNGAHGQTFTAMQNTLGLSGLSNDEINQSYQNLITMFSNLDPNVTFNIANSIWYKNNFSVLDPFLTVDSTFYNAEIRPLDFSAANAADIMNSWVSEKTDGKIQSIINPPIPASAVMYLMNALYFNGTWTYIFHDTTNQNLTFQLPGGTTEEDSMMIVHDTLNYYSDATFQAVELPYGDGDYSMIVLLPSTLSSSANAAALTQSEWNSVLNGLKPEDVQITMPKFRIEYSTSLKDALTQMGMGTAFSPEADFTRISPAGGLSISDVLHKTYIDVNEKGTEAAAVTVVTFVSAVEQGGHVGPYLVNVNRPFIFLIKENHSNTIMFMGVVVDPNSTVSN